jgi:hypothetical protein
MARSTTKDTSGTSFHGTRITTTVGKLKKLFPNSYYDNNNGEDKSNYDFELETDNGDVFTIYDWKEGRPIGDNEKITFNIGGFSSTVTIQAKNELLRQL